MKVDNVLIEYLNNPIGIGIRSPRITWNDFDINKQDSFEVFYEVNGVRKTSGIIKSSSMNYIFKEEFQSRNYVSFKIKIYDKNGNCSDDSLAYHFEMGLLSPNDWVSHWISGNYKVNKNKRYPVDYFKKDINIKSIKKARLYISACGLYEAFINDVRVGNFILTPGSTDYHKRIQYQTYDVTNLLKEGKNVINLLLADGWYRGSIGAKGRRNTYGTVTKVIAQLEVFDNDNNKTTYVTDDSWSWSNDGPIQFSDLKDGEIIDNRKVPSYKGKAKIVKFDANLKESNNEAVIENEYHKPIKIWKSKSGKQIVEFPNNIAGYLSFFIKAKKGDTISIEMGEILDDDGELTLKNIQCVHKKKKTPLQKIIYTCKDGENNYHSKFYFAGFKYLSIDSNIEFNKENIQQIGISTKLDNTSSFKCSNKLINIFYDNTLRSLRSNSIDIPTDCPTRERMGWTGDSQVFFETASFLTNYAAFTRKHLVDIFDRQTKNGCLPQIAPYSSEDWFMSVMNGSVGWADVGILSPLRFYKKYGDKRILIDNYEKMVKYAKFMINRCGRAKGIYAIYAKPLHLSKENKKYAVNTGQSYGEWAEPNDIKAFAWTDFAEPHPEESMAYTYWMMDNMIEISNIIGRKENNALFIEYRDGINKAYQELVDKNRFSLDTNRQAKLVRPLYLNLLNEEQKIKAKKNLIKALNDYDWRLGTGFLSTPFILYVLSDIDVNYAYKLLENEKMPGWLYMAKNNTGTIWEAWEGPNAQQGIASLNHYSKGAMVEWLFKGMCGINIIKENMIRISPIIGGNIKFANASYQSIYGLIKSSWKIEDNKIVFEIEVPGNVECEFEYKDIKKHLENGKHVIEYSL